MAAERPFDVVTFDCYGTLIDWEGGIARAFVEAARRDGLSLRPEAVLRAYLELEPAVEGEAYRGYREVLAEAARRTAGRLGWRLEPARARFLPESLADWAPFPDTNPALARLSAAGYRLAILSNTDEDLLAASRRHFTVPFDFWITAEQVKAYKPARPHFDRARDRIGGVRWLHAAQSYFHDVTPARALGIPVAWINRQGQRPTGEARPEHEFRTLTGLADWLAPSG
jgi:2-haloalkanoic acid dehalogenase type II